MKKILTGRLHSAAMNTTCAILSSIEDISLEQAWRTSGLSSNTENHFDAEDAVIVATR